MRLAQAQLTNYRSIRDSTLFQIERDKTILVGVNEAGKTAVLRALQSINPSPDTPKLDYLRDYPRAELNEIQTGRLAPSALPVAEVRFDLEDADRRAAAEFAPVADDAFITVYRYLDGSRTWTVHGLGQKLSMKAVAKDLVRMRAYLATQSAPQTLLDEIDVLTAVDSGADLNAHAAAVTAMLNTALPLIPEGSPESERWDRLEAAAEEARGWQKATGAIWSRLPLLVYYSTYFTVRPRIDLESLAARQERGDIDSEYDFGNLSLLKFLGFTARELSELGSGAPVKPSSYETNADVRKQHDEALTEHQRELDDRQYRLNAAGVKLTQDIRRVWGDDNVQLRIVADGQYLKVMVVDDLGVEVELDQRSEGFRWIVSFFVVFRAQAADDLAGAILLLDEPGLSLHALKQQEFRKTVSLLGVDNQIIYTTHSPFMVGSDELDLVRIVEMSSREAGTKVHTRLQVDDPRSIYPLQAALGYELAQHMFAQKKNLVCEGVTDMFYLNALNEAAGEAGKPTFRNSPAIIPAGTASKVAYFCTIYAGQNLSVAALLDSDTAGDQAATQDALVALLPKRAVLRAGDFIDGVSHGAETEDLLRETLLSLAKELGWDSISTAAAQPHRPVMDILTSEHKNVSKWKLAKALTLHLRDDGFDALTAAEQGAWEKLVAAVNKAL
ncbi:AAA family ATPase [Curtobacterium sp. VKM Ac-2852]|uniref:AAA family ATPase n=1 Tax=Curtobacterium sp. VKM Ac-2852 TaxID=2739024 RepID=UPI0015645ECC|nr:AAA family ATPase [Curtobacterium sp. VKM Ac-2852]NQX25672.1 AAA family ATPase [Curtobacterium sp. VKM Ac-2852]